MSNKTAYPCHYHTVEYDGHTNASGDTYITWETPFCNRCRERGESHTWVFDPEQLSEFKSFIVRFPNPNHIHATVEKTHEPDEEGGDVCPDTTSSTIA